MRKLPVIQTTEQLYYQNILRYDTVHLKRYKLALEYMDENSVVLDYGCGAGYGSWLMSGEAGEVVGVDADINAHTYAKVWYSRPTITYLWRDTPPEGQYDVITCFEVIEHVDDAEGLVAKFHELLNPEGRLICSVPNESLLPHADSHNHFHKRHYLPKDFDELLTSSGFKIERFLTQKYKSSPEIIEGWVGMNLIAVARKM